MDVQHTHFKADSDTIDDAATLLDICLETAARYLRSGRHSHTVGPLSRGAHLFRAAEPAEELFIVESGCFKLYAYDKAGREYIHGFRLRGSILGLHGLYGHNHQFNALALAPSTVFRLPLAEIAELGARVPAFTHSLLRLIGREITDNVFLSGNFTAEERLAAFLVSFSRKLDRYAPRVQVTLPMSRGDIAVYLRLTLPTVSRILSRFRREGIIRSDYHHIEILDPVHLAKLCSNVPMPEPQEFHAATLSAS
jgi:CRP/FNR family transcriptional regulator